MSATKYRINEIFYSLQGEGYHTGMPAVFVRFSGCNLRCPFCDTEFADYREMDAEEIAEEIERLVPQKRALPLIVLTGGEPSLQADEALVARLHKTGMVVCMETNGTHTLPQGIDWVTCSPKAGSRVVLEEADELKIVLTDDCRPEQWAERIKARHLFLQPCSCRNNEAVVEYILSHPQWRLSLQTHKYLNIR